MEAARTSSSYLIVDDDSSYLDRLARAFQQLGIERFHAALTYDAAISAAGGAQWDRAILDLRLEDRRSGLDLCRELKRRQPAIRVVINTNYPSLEAFRLAVAAGAVDVIHKTQDVAAILHAFARSDRDSLDLTQVPLAPPTLEQVEWEHINRVLTLTGGQPVLPADILGIDRSTLYRKLQKMPAHNLGHAAHVAEQLLRREVTLRRLPKTSAKRKRSSKTGDGT